VKIERDEAELPLPSIGRTTLSFNEWKTSE